MPSIKTRTAKRPRKTKHDYLVTDERAILHGIEVQRRMKQQYNSKVKHEAKKFQAMLDALPFDVAILCANEDIRPFMLSAASFSAKSLKCYSEKARGVAIGKLLKSLTGTAAEKRNELVSLFRTNEGETRNGAVKNKFAQTGERKFVREIQAALRRRGGAYDVRRQDGKIKSMSWRGRCLLFNFTPCTGRNMDALLVSADSEEEAKVLARADASCWLAFGELKSGIDKAGADERWKTASGMIHWTRRNLRGYKSMPIFFAATTIVPAMAKEIRGELRTGKLAFAANMTKSDQRAALADWLISL